MIQWSSILVHPTYDGPIPCWDVPMRRRHEVHGIREREDREHPLMVTLDESLSDNTNKFINLARYFAWLDDVAKDSGAKVDRVVVSVETGWVEVATRVWERLAAIDVYTERVASWILVWHREPEE